MDEHSSDGRERLITECASRGVPMRIPLPKSSLLTLALVGAVLTGALTVGLANPDAVAHYRNDAARWLATDDTVDAAAGSAPVADVSDPIAEPAVTPTATPAPPSATPALAGASSTTAAPAPVATPAATPTPVPDFTPEVQQRPATASHGDDDGYEHDEYDEREDDDD